MSHFVGKIVLNKLIRTRIMEVEMDGMTEKGIFIPFKDNDIIQYGEEWQLWFRAMAYRERKSRFSHFIMKFIPRSQIKKMSSAQIEAFANHSIGGMIKTGKVEKDEQSEVMDTTDFIKNNL